MLSVVSLSDPNPAVPLLRDLRNGLEEATFTERLARAWHDGYRILAAKDGASILGIAGYRVVHDLFWGKTLYVDDLIVAASSRGQGIGAQLLTAMNTHARETGCDHIRLCSGLDRDAAHRFYKSNEMVPRSLQFVAGL